MKPIILDNISFNINSEELCKSLHIKDGSKFKSDFMKLFHKAEKSAYPKAAYGISKIQHKNSNTITIDGININSTILSKNLTGVKHVFPYVISCGVEIDEWSKSLKKFHHKFWAEQIKTSALNIAYKAFKKDVEYRYKPGLTSSMNPGSLEDWPLESQKNLFTILGKGGNMINVSLNENYIMTPFKSVSGIQYPSDIEFSNCQLCARKNCPTRKSFCNKIIHHT